MPETPLDLLMTRLGLSNADLVQASPDQLTFKNVHKGRIGKTLTPNIQEKIVNALRLARPDLRVRRRDLFSVEASPELREGVRKALALIAEGKLNYPQFVDRLIECGVYGYDAEVGPNRYTYYGPAGETFVEQGASVSADEPGRWNEAAFREALTQAQQRKIDHPAFLRKIHAAGVGRYEVNTRKRRILYRHAEGAYGEAIPEGAAVPPPALPAAPAAPKKAPAGRKKRPGVVRTTRKARVSANKRYFAAKKRRRKAARGKR